MLQPLPHSIPITPDLLKKYDRPGPRYTSYPTAVEFSTDYDAQPPTSNPWRWRLRVRTIRSRSMCTCPSASIDAPFADATWSLRGAGRSPRSI